MANFGIGVGAFMDGYMKGANFKEQQAENKSRRELRDLQVSTLKQEVADKQGYRDMSQQAATAATSARNADIDSHITMLPDQSGWKVGDKTYANEAEARTAASGQVDSFMDYYMKNSLPKMQEYWASQGQPEKAQALGKWMEDENVKKGARLWANAVRSFQLGDKEGFKSNLMKAYNQQGYFDDGMTADGIEDVVDDKGNLLGYQITFTDGNGKVTSQQFDSSDVAQMGLNALSPAEVFSHGFDQVKTAQTQQAAIAKENRERQWDVTKMGIQQQNTLAAQNNQSDLRRAEEAEKRATGGDSTKVREAQAIDNYLAGLGYDEEYRRSIAPRLLGIERQSQSPQDRLTSVITMLNNDYQFQRLSDAEKVKRAQDLIKAQDSALNEGQQRQSQPSGMSTAPVQSSGQGVPIWDNETNSIIYR